MGSIRNITVALCAVDGSALRIVIGDERSDRVLVARLTDGHVETVICEAGGQGALSPDYNTSSRLTCLRRATISRTR